MPRGPFAELPEHSEASINDVMESLEPRDFIEQRQAQQIGNLYLRLARLDRYEAEAMTWLTDNVDDCHPAEVALHVIEGGIVHSEVDWRFFWRGRW